MFELPAAVDVAERWSVTVSPVDTGMVVAGTTAVRVGASTVRPIVPVTQVDGSPRGHTLNRMLPIPGVEGAVYEIDDWTALALPVVDVAVKVVQSAPAAFERNMDAGMSVLSPVVTVTAGSATTTSVAGSMVTSTEPA